jgi:hypothetical protein
MKMDVYLALQPRSHHVRAHMANPAWFRPGPPPLQLTQHRWALNLLHLQLGSINHTPCLHLQQLSCIPMPAGPSASKPCHSWRADRSGLFCPLTAAVRPAIASILDDNSGDRLAFRQPLRRRHVRAKLCLSYRHNTQALLGLI